MKCRPLIPALDGYPSRIRCPATPLGRNTCIGQHRPSLGRGVSTKIDTNHSINYVETDYAYDSMGRLKRTLEPSGNITRVIYDARGLVTQVWKGTDDSPTGSNYNAWVPTVSTSTNNGQTETANGTDMVEVSGYQYDIDGNLTR